MTAKEDCSHCGTKRKLNEQFDAYYCPKCLFWLERICPDRSCEFCSKRPKYPKKQKGTISHKILKEKR